MSKKNTGAASSGADDAGADRSARLAEFGRRLKAWREALRPKLTQTGAGGWVQQEGLWLSADGKENPLTARKMWCRLERGEGNKIPEDKLVRAVMTAVGVPVGEAYKILQPDGEQGAGAASSSDVGSMPYLHVPGDFYEHYSDSDVGAFIVDFWQRLDGLKLDMATRKRLFKLFKDVADVARLLPESAFESQAERLFSLYDECEFLHRQPRLMKQTLDHLTKTADLVERMSNDG